MVVNVPFTDRFAESNLFRAIRVSKHLGAMAITLESIPLPETVPDDHVLLRVHYSCINFKDIMACQGNPAVTRRFPHTPGIDAAGTVALSSDAKFPVGAEVLVCCRAMGMNHPGGFAEYVQVPIAWLEPKPVGWSLRDCMVLGTAGFTAALAVDLLIRDRQFGGHMTESPSEKPDKQLRVAISGVTGGVGMFASLMLSHLGCVVTALVSSQTLQRQAKGLEPLLHNLGVHHWLDRDAVSSSHAQNLAPACYDGVIDVAGGALLANLIKQLHPHGLAIATGMVADTQLPLNVLPFILRGVTLKGINAESSSEQQRADLWQRMLQSYLPQDLTALYQQVTLAQLPEMLMKLCQGYRSSGRILINCMSETSNVLPEMATGSR